MYSPLRTALLTGGLTFSVIIGTISVYALGTGTDLVSLMDKLLLDTSISTDGTVKNSDKVDGLHASDILNAAGGGGGGGCYYSTATTCMTGYAKAPGSFYDASTAHNICCALDTSITCSAMQPGSTCQGNTVYAFYLAGNHYMTTPGNCDNYTTPFCDGNTDTLQLAYKISPLNNTANSTTDGSGNTTILSTTFAPSQAAQYCYNLVYGGYSDWFLPALDQTMKMASNKNAIGGFQTNNYYWSSTNASGDAYYVVFSSSPSYNIDIQNQPHYIRCIRKI